MNTYIVYFTGRKRGAIGALATQVAIVKGEDQERAHIRLYDTYEHVHGPKFTIARTSEPGVPECT